MKNDLVYDATINMQNSDYYVNISDMKYVLNTTSKLTIVLEPKRREKLIQLISENENVSRTYAAAIIDLVLNNLAQVVV